MSNQSKKISELVKGLDILKKKKFIPGETRIPVSGKLFDENEIINGVNSILDCWWTEGRYDIEFREKLSSFLGVRYAIPVNSGSSANLLAFTTLTSPLLKEKRIKPGDEVITIAASFPTTINPIIQNNCVPVFLDVELETYNINTELIERVITKKTKAVFIAHTLGNPFNLDKIKQVCDKHNLWLIEDCCDALGSKYKGNLVGTFGDLATFSFYPAHQITAGEGGAVVTNNPILKKIAESFKDWGRDCWCAPGRENTCGRRFSQKHGDLPYGYDHKYVYSHLGYNLKWTDMQASIAVAQIQKLPRFVERRKENFKKLKQGMKRFEKYLILPESTKNSDPSWFGFIITIREGSGVKRTELVNFLEENKISTRLVFAGNITKQPYFKNLKYKVVGKLINTDIVMNNSFWIGVYPGITDEMINYMLLKFREFFN
ncbi:lipopolysaccharide biosynthesis protein RfbH [Candidatus Woesearchaeota archaeon]|nr:lipopolysaccharide biosynthesis protein RfbH [Candidatus Woesearchaeota archaeon]